MKIWQKPDPDMLCILMALGAALAFFITAVVPSATTAALTAVPGLSKMMYPDDVWTDDATQQMADYRHWVGAWAQSMNLPMPEFDYVWVGQPACGRSAQKSTAEFCRNNQEVYFTVAGMREWTSLDPLGGLVTVAHEVSHSFQYKANPKMPGGPALERQAYCGSGVFIRWASVNMPGVTNEAVEHWERIFLRNALEDAEHGSVQAQVDAFDLGYLAGDLKACAQVDPKVPLDALS